MTSLLPLIPILPLAGFVLTALFGRRYPHGAHNIALWAVAASWAVASFVAFAILTHADPFGIEGAGITLWTWIPAAGFQAEMGLYADSLTACLLIVVTSIGLLVHVYSVGYMAHDPGRWRFFAYLNLFMFSMLLLVLADNFLLVFAGWELVGLCSYLLIGFWYPRRSAAEGAKKAFLVNRVGDMGFALGIMAIWTQLGTVNMRETFDKFGQVPHEWQIAIALLILCGAVGKSAQFPLHVWLPDAMEGPTPVSALIHAATMVNAGVYLVARCNPIFGAASEVMVVVAAIGIFTAILAASHRLHPDRHQARPGVLHAQPARLHVRRPGSGRLDGGHLPPHGPRLLQGPALPGLGLGHPCLRRRAGHAPHGRPVAPHPDHLPDHAGRIDRHRRSAAPGRLLLQGRDPGQRLQGRLLLGVGHRFRGRRHDGLLHVPADGHDVLGIEPPGPRKERHVHESPPSMTGPLLLLAIPSVLLGLAIGFPPESGWLHQWLAPIFERTVEASGRHEAAYQLLGIDGALAVATTALVAIAIVLAWRLFGVEIPALGLRAGARPERVRAVSAAPGMRLLYRGSAAKWWFDDINHFLFVRLGGRLAAGAFWFDRTIVDGTVNGIGAATAAAGSGLRHVQTGRVQNYALGIALGLLAMMAGYLVIAVR